ncbi:MAG: hypothetical protein ABR608_14890 [Pseudonocardiaceae bacterium]
MFSQQRIESANQFFWRRAPRIAGSLSPTLRDLLVDSRYLLAWPRAAALVPSSALALGALLGLFHPGNVYSGSLAVVALLVVSGATGSTTGLWFLAGYVPVDLLVRPGAWSSEVSQLGLLIADLVLALLLVVIAASVVRLRAELLLRGSSLQAVQAASSSAPWPLAEAISGALVYMMLVWAWLQSVPALIRPVATWAGVDPLSTDVQPVQGNVELLILLAGLSAGAVSWVEWRSSHPRDPSVSERAHADLADVLGPERDRRTYPLAVVYSIRAVFGVAIAAGLLAHVWEAVILWAALVLGQIAQARIGQATQWNNWVLRLPVAARLFFVLIGTTVGGLLILPWVFTRASSLLPVLVVTMIGLALTAIALPTPARSSLARGGQS